MGAKNPDKTREHLQSCLEQLVRKAAKLNRTIDARSETYVERRALVYRDSAGVEHELYRRVVGGSGSSVVIGKPLGALFEECVVGLARMRPDAVSTDGAEEAIDELLLGFAQAGWSLDGQRKNVADLVADVAKRPCRVGEVAIPVWGLSQEIDELQVGKCVLVTQQRFAEMHPKASDAVREGTADRKSTANSAVALVSVAGYDDFTQVRLARDETNRALNLLRALAYPVLGSVWIRQFGVAESGGSGSSYVFLDDSLKWGICAAGDFGGPGFRDFMLDRDMLAGMNQAGLRAISSFIERPKRSYERALVMATRWMGEATKPDSMEGKLLKLCFALDAMLGDETDVVPDKGKKARISERAAFLLAATGSERLQVHSDIDRFLGMRNKLAHGSAHIVFDRDVTACMEYARRILETLVLTKRFASVGELAKWVLRESMKG